jgi:hypothetical protein
MRHDFWPYNSVGAGVSLEVTLPQQDQETGHDN